MSAAMETMPRLFSGKRLRARRLAVGWTETKLGGEVGCSAQTIKDLEAGKYAPGGKLLGAIADALKLKRIDDLYDRVP